VLRELRERGVRWISEPELAFRFLQGPLIAVTGTNGKTTTSRMIGTVLEEAGVDAAVCGNIGDPFIAAVAERPAVACYVVEVSSQQLAFCETFHPSVAVLTNLAPDHLDWHGNYWAYREAKRRIAARQGAADWFVYPGEQPDLADLAPVQGPPDAGEGVWVDGDRVVARFGNLDVSFGSTGRLAERGRPFLEDALAAGAAVLAFGAGQDAVAAMLATFTPEGHRVEAVGVLAGVTFYDDSKATNPHATLAALRGFERAVLIAGGRSKGIDLAPLREEAARLRAVVALGEAAREIAGVFRGSDVPVKIVGSMDEAVDVGFTLAQPGDALLLSPACSSRDMFADYAERGRAYRAACVALVERTR
jgi:UDP-N-acetylmuramoylalanine--D-glutamate ligase